MRLSRQNQRNKRSTAFIPLLYEIAPQHHGFHSESDDKKDIFISDLNAPQLRITPVYLVPLHYTKICSTMLRKLQIHSTQKSEIIAIITG